MRRDSPAGVEADEIAGLEQGAPSQRSWERQGVRFSPQKHQNAQALQLDVSQRDAGWTSHLQNCTIIKIKNVLFQATKFGVLCYHSHRKCMRSPAGGQRTATVASESNSYTFSLPHV